MPDLMDSDTTEQDLTARAAVAAPWNTDTDGVAHFLMSLKSLVETGQGGLWPSDIKIFDAH